MRVSWIKILFAGLLLVGLPLFVWAVLTQRIELRKRAATAEPVEICWNRVITFNDTYNWPNSCKGSPRTDQICTQILVPLTSAEISGYNEWISLGSPYIPGCGGPVPTTSPGECSPCVSNSSCTSGLICQYVPTPTPNCPNGNDGPCSMPQNYPYQACVKPDGSSRCPPMPPTPPPLSPTQAPWPAINWTTPYAYLQAGEITITANGKTFTGKSTGMMTVVSDPGNPNYTTLEVTWTENNVEMRMFIYFHADTVTTPPPYRRWWVDEIRTYNGNSPGDWIYYHRPQLSSMAIMGMGIPFVTDDLVITTSEGGVGQIRFKKLWLRGFLNEGSPSLTPTPTPPVGCYYKQVQCFQAPCPPILICPTIAPTVTLTPTPTPMPTAMKFLVRLAGVNGQEAQGATINVKLKLQNGIVRPLDKPLVLNPIGNGVYAATATLTNPLPAGTFMRVLIKGEKHSQVEFCRLSGQTDPCNDTEYIPSSSNSFDFTGRPLPPGDLNQDGRVNGDDLKLITDIFKKPSSQQTPLDLKTADVNYSGKVDSLDLILVFQTLETRYDEQ